VNPERRVRELIDRLDERIAAQIEPILDHPDFQALHRAWRELGHLVRNTRTGERIRIEVLNVAQGDLEDRRDLFRHLHDMVYGGFGGEPYALVVVAGDPGDALDLVAEDIHAPIVTDFTLAWRIGDAFERTGWFAGLPGDLPDRLAAGLFARYVKCIFRDLQGRFPNRESAEEHLSEWLAGYVADGETSAERPLAAASVRLEYDIDDARRYRFRLKTRAGHGIDSSEERSTVGRLHF
jgi:predicted component of type VI protein secretion system